MTKAELTELISEIERFPVGEIEMKVEHLISHGVTVEELTPTQQKIKWLGTVLGTETVVEYHGDECTIDCTVIGLVQWLKNGKKVISAELLPCNGAGTIRCRIDKVERKEA